MAEKDQAQKTEQSEEVKTEEKVEEKKVEEEKQPETAQEIYDAGFEKLGDVMAAQVLLAEDPRGVRGLWEVDR